MRWRIIDSAYIDNSANRSTIGFTVVNSKGNGPANSVGIITGVFIGDRAQRCLKRVHCIGAGQRKYSGVCVEVARDRGGVRERQYILTDLVIAGELHGC